MIAQGYCACSNTSPLIRLAYQDRSKRVFKQGKCMRIRKTNKWVKSPFKSTHNQGNGDILIILIALPSTYLISFVYAPKVVISSIVAK